MISQVFLDWQTIGEFAAVAGLHRSFGAKPAPQDDKPVSHYNGSRITKRSPFSVQLQFQTVTVPSFLFRIQLLP